jgi:hypothetical protein
VFEGHVGMARFLRTLVGLEADDLQSMWKWLTTLLEMIGFDNYPGNVDDDDIIGQVLMDYGSHAELTADECLQVHSLRLLFDLSSLLLLRLHPPFLHLY